MAALPTPTTRPVRRDEVEAQVRAARERADGEPPPPPRARKRSGFAPSSPEERAARARADGPDAPPATVPPPRARKRSGFATSSPEERAARRRAEAEAAPGRAGAQADAVPAPPSKPTPPPPPVGPSGVVARTQQGVLRPGSLIDGRFRAWRVLARGGMGVVLHAIDHHDGGEVALKIPSRRDPDTLKRFERECAATLDASGGLHLPKVHGTGVDPRVGPYLAVEYVHGENLVEHVSRTGPLSPVVAIRLGKQLLDAIGRIHRTGLVHRDVKPANVMLTEDRAVLVDLGAAKSDAMPTVTAPRTLVGSLRWVAPELLRDGGSTAPNERVDLYGVALVLWYALTGKPPYFPLEDPAELAQAIVDGPPTPVAALRPSVPKLVSRMLEEALHPEPRRRPRDAATFAALLDRVADAADLWGERDSDEKLTRQYVAMSEEEAAALVDADARPTMLPPAFAGRSAPANDARPEDARPLPAPPSGPEDARPTHAPPAFIDPMPPAAPTSAAASPAPSAASAGPARWWPLGLALAAGFGAAFA
ncbi:MAG TPA: serine/threonine-protein kinase, partial [Polyangiaceae bacterium LLY-WYZ-15_(1-7)]|nr:serine/threonine-protein kinase [Polyangiaceae bacterium LLY-WYZ-15_(1-7)]